MNTQFINDLITGKWRHLSPRREDPSEPSLELLASLHLDEQERSQDDKRVAIKLFVIGYITALGLLGLSCALILAIANVKAEHVHAFFSVILIAIIYLGFAYVILPSRLSVSADKRLRKYEVAISSFWRNLQALAKALEFENSDMLGGLRRELLAERGLSIGVRLQTFIRVNNDSDDLSVQEKLTIARHQLEHLHRTLEKFKLAPRGGLGAYGRYKLYEGRPEPIST